MGNIHYYLSFLESQDLYEHIKEILEKSCNLNHLI